MKIADTISVNPSKTTLGHVETPASTIFRAPVIGVEEHSRSINLFKVLFPSRATALSSVNKYEVPLRAIFATILIVSGLTMIQAATSALAVCSLCFGGLLAIGLFTRPIMLGAAVYYCVAGALSIRHGAVDITLFSLMFGCLIFALKGAGKYSADMAIRAAVNRHQRNVGRKAESLGYKAFHTVKY